MRQLSLCLKSSDTGTSAPKVFVAIQFQRFVEVGYPVCLLVLRVSIRQLRMKLQTMKGDCYSLC
jgi:hypothetical protein